MEQNRDSARDPDTFHRWLVPLLRGRLRRAGLKEPRMAERVCLYPTEIADNGEYDKRSNICQNAADEQAAVTWEM